MKSVFALFAVLSLMATSCQSKFLNPDTDPKQLAPLQKKAEDMAAKLSNNWPASEVGGDHSFASVVTGTESWTVKFTTKYSAEQVEKQLAVFGAFTSRQEYGSGANDDPVIYAASLITRTGEPQRVYFTYSGAISTTETKNIGGYVDFFPISTWLSGTYYFQGKPIQDNVVTVKIVRFVASATVDTVQPSSTFTTTRQP